MIAPFRAQTEITADQQIAQQFDRQTAATAELLGNLMPWTRRQDISKFLARTQLYQEILKTPGIILDLGTYRGQSAFSWLHLSSILEPYNHTRRIVSFDTFSGFPPNQESPAGTFAVESDWLQTLQHLTAAHDQNRPLGHAPKLRFVPGKLPDTLILYLEKHPETVVSLLHLDVDLYEPTIGCLKAAWKYLPVGAVVAFDELNHPAFPGETRAYREWTGDRYPLHRSPLDPWLCWFRKT